MSSVATLENPATTVDNPRRDVDSPCRTKPDGTVEIFDALMEPGRPYPFQVDGWWFIAMKPAGASRAGIYYVGEEENAGG